MVLSSSKILVFTPHKAEKLLLADLQPPIKSCFNEHLTQSFVSIGTLKNDALRHDDACSAMKV